jgi:hypothetical protein
MPHLFLFSPGLWLGEGKVSFSTSPEKLHFYTRWQILPTVNDAISCQQTVEMQDELGSIQNSFVLSQIQATSFTIELSNHIIGTVTGHGIIDTQTIAWEFHQQNAHQEAFEGFEVYELLSNNDYMLHAEYASSEQLRTIIDGRLWLKGS